MILKFNDGASQHGFVTPAEAWQAGCSFAVLDANGRPTTVGLPFEQDGRRGVSLFSPSDLWHIKRAEIDCVFVETSAHSPARDIPSDTARLTGMLRDVRDEVVAARRSVAIGGPADHAALMAIGAIDGLASFLAALRPSSNKAPA